MAHIVLPYPVLMTYYCLPTAYAVIFTRQLANLQMVHGIIAVMVVVIGVDISEFS